MVELHSGWNWPVGVSRSTPTFDRSLHGPSESLEFEFSQDSKVGAGQLRRVTRSADNVLVKSILGRRCKR